MKELKELKFEELTIEQKIGMVTCCLFPTHNRTVESDEFIFNLIKNHALGCLWVDPDTPNFEEVMARVKELADYPLLIICDAESGMKPYKIGRHNALGMTDSVELAYEFGKVTAITAKQKGYNVVCDPVVDMMDGPGMCGSNIRSMGSDKHKVSSLAVAMAKGMHDGGVLSVAKHYPSAKTGDSGGRLIDSHMAETSSPLTKEELLEYNLYPYLELMKEGLLDGIMTGHCRLPNIDPDYPASLSKKVIGIIREQGFDGFAITDALQMMGIVTKFGATDSKGLAIENGNDIALAWTHDARIGYNAVLESYKKGILSDERLDAATKVVLAAQHKVFEMQPKFTELTEYDIKAIEKINTDSVYAKTDDGLKPSISRDGKHLFVILTDNDAQVSDDGKVDVDTFSGGWYNPADITKRLKELFPNSEYFALREFPTGWNVHCALDSANGCDDVVFITRMEGGAYKGKEEFTPPIISLIDAMQVTNKISTIVHYGNPYTLEPLPHISRIIIGGASSACVMAALEVLADNYPAKGKLTYDINLQ